MKEFNNFDLRWNELCRKSEAGLMKQFLFSGLKAIVGLIYVTDIIDWREISHHFSDQ